MVQPPHQVLWILVSGCSKVLDWQDSAWHEHAVWPQCPRLGDLARAAAAGLEGADAVPAAVGHWLVLVAASAQVGNEAAGQGPTLVQRKRPRHQQSLHDRVCQQRHLIRT